MTLMCMVLAILKLAEVGAIAHWSWWGIIGIWFGGVIVLGVVAGVIALAPSRGAADENDTD